MYSKLCMAKLSPIQNVSHVENPFSAHHYLQSDLVMEIRTIHEKNSPALPAFSLDILRLGPILLECVEKLAKLPNTPK